MGIKRDECPSWRHKIPGIISHSETWPRMASHHNENRMRTADDFDRVYAAPDPWQVAGSARRAAQFRRIIEPLARGKTALDLGIITSLEIVHSADR